MTNIETQIVTLNETLTALLNEAAHNTIPARKRDTQSIKVAYRALRKAAKISQQIEALEAQLTEEQEEVNHLQALNLTDMETAVMEAFLPTLFEGELEYSETTDKDISSITGIEMKQLRGVLGSLVKKGIINCDHSAWEEEVASMNIEGMKRKSQKKVYVELRQKFFYLHPSHE